MTPNNRILDYYSPTLEKVTLAFSMTFALFLLMRILNFHGISDGYGFPLPVEVGIWSLNEGVGEITYEISLGSTLLDTVFWYLITSPALTEIKKYRGV